MRIFADFTPDIPLEPESVRPYLLWRVALLSTFIVGTVFVILGTAFPNARKHFGFQVYHGAENTIADPRYPDGTAAESGLVQKGQMLMSNASASGDFSKITFSFRRETGSTPPSGTVSVIRAYRSFLVPEGAPVGFRDGSLLSSEGRYFLASEGTLRPFPSEADIRRRGYEPASFLSVAPESVAASEEGPEIVPNESLPDGTVIVFDDRRYLVQDGSAVPFSSTRAFLSRYRNKDALQVGKDTFSALSESDERIGFLDGTLISYGEAVYAVEGTMLRPIDSPETFLGKGYGWDSVIAATGEEFGIYERGRLYTEQQPHPDGTIFFDTETERSFLAEKGMKREIPPAVLSQFSAITPVPVHEADLGGCVLRGNSKRLSCEIAWNPDSAGVGAEYQVSFVPDHDVTLRDMDFTFSREMNQKNLDRFLRETAVKIRTRSPLSR